MYTKTGLPILEKGYVKASDGIGIYFKAIGSGPPIVLCSGISVSFVYWKYLVPLLAEKYTVIQWNYRGHGKSETPLDMSTATIPQLADDLDHVLSHLGFNKYILLGHSMGVQVILEYYQQHRKKVRALIPAFGTYEKPLGDVFNLQIMDPILRMLLIFTKLKNPIIPIGWRFVQSAPLKMNFHAARVLKIIHPKKCSWNDFHPFFDHFKHLDTRTFFELANSAQKYSAKNVLDTITVPTLILGAKRDRFTPVEASRKMAKRILNSEYVEIEDAGHAAFLEEPDVINRRIMKFLQHVTGRSPIA